MKEHIYSTDEYEVKIGDPVVDAEVKATSTSVAIPCAAIPDGKYLVSLEVNGTAVAYRDTFSFASGSCTVGDYTLAYSSYAVTVSTTSNNEVVRLKIEPVEVYVTDAMKAAVVEVSPPSPAELPAITDADNGKVLTANSGVWVAQTPTAGGGDTEYVHFTVTGDNVTCDHTAAEINDAIQEGKDVIGILPTGIAPSLSGVSKVSTGGNSYQLNFAFSVAYFGGSGNKLYVYNITVQSSGSISKTVKYASLTS